MATAKATYLGNLRTQATHIQSGTAIITDAPTDNNGKGEAFSPTDLVATALGSCMVTIMGIVAERDGIDMSGLSWEVTKVMSANPRKISKVTIHFTWPQPQASTEQLQKLKNAARTCPVALSLHPDLEQDIHFNF
ncbi:OsmC family protein [Penaeicola halotolerans]|uniref:OsmC family protein n=1 Tax=Penaeicola halotolerans TaxID=2793196 RepID=UPI001CF811FC|nr:OsmC family protein [Penaeicola halotolerans]